MTKLLYVGQQVADDLADGISANLDRYREGDFSDMEAAGDWRIPLSFDADVGALSSLLPDGSPASEIANSLVVGHVLAGLTPSLARENRIWVRLSHVECLDYSRRRWLARDSDDARLERNVRKHFFAPGLQGCRDDHAVARLWWNHRIAKFVMPENPARVLNVVLARSDIRMNLLERSGIGARPALGRAIVRSLEKSKELLEGELLFREYMKAVNFNGAGIAFEVWSEREIDAFMDRCLDAAVRSSSLVE